MVAGEMTKIAQGIVYVGMVGLGAGAAAYTSYEVSAFLGRLVYPLSPYDKKGVEAMGHVETFFWPNAGIHIDKEQYEKLSKIRKISNAALLLLAGAFTGALTGAFFNRIVVVALNPANPVLFTLIGSLSCAVVGSITGGFHDPKIGIPYFYSSQA